MRSDRISAYILLSVFCAWLPSSYAKKVADETVKIGVSGPYSGGSSPMGISMRNGVRLAIQEINNIGGFNGRKLELVERDDEAKNEVGAKIAEELVKQKVAATIGIVNTGVGLASIGIYQKAKIPLMIAVSTGTTLTKEYAPPAAAENYIFRVSPTLELEAKMLAEDLKQKNLLNTAFLADETAYGEAGLKAFQRQSEKAGLTLAVIERFKIGDRNMSAQVGRAKASGAQAIVIWGIGPEMAAIAKNMEALGWKVPIMGSWTLSMENFSSLAGKAGDGALMPQTFIEDFGATNKINFMNSYLREFKTTKIPSPMSAAQGYDGMHLLYLAMVQADSTDGTKIKAALEDMLYNYEGVITRYKKPFTPGDHDAITQNMLMLGKVNAGRVDYASAADERKGLFMRKKQNVKSDN